MMRALYFLLLRYTQAAAKLGHRELRAASGTLFLALTVAVGRLETFAAF